MYRNRENVQCQRSLEFSLRWRSIRLHLALLWKGRVAPLALDHPWLRRHSESDHGFHRSPHLNSVFVVEGETIAATHVSILIDEPHHDRRRAKQLTFS